jgi:Na+/H+ antiporter NhaB
MLHKQQVFSLILNSFLTVFSFSTVNFSAFLDITTKIVTLFMSLYSAYYLWASKNEDRKKADEIIEKKITEKLTSDN